MRCLGPPELHWLDPLLKQGLDLGLRQIDWGAGNIEGEVGLILPLPSLSIPPLSPSPPSPFLPSPPLSLPLTLSPCRNPLSFSPSALFWGRRLSTNFFCWHKLSEHPTGPFRNTPRVRDVPAKLLGHPRFPPCETKGKQTFEGGNELFDHHPFTWKTPEKASEKAEEEGWPAKRAKKRTCENRSVFQEPRKGRKGGF